MKQRQIDAAQLGAASLSMLLLLAACSRSPEDGAAFGVHGYTTREIATLAKCPEWSIERVARNGEATSLYVYVSSGEVGAGSIVVLRPGQAPERRPRPAKITFLNDALEVVASSDLPNEHVMIGTQPRRGGPSGGFGVDPSGRYYFLEQPDDGTVMGLISDALDKERSTLVGHRIFALGDRVFLFGWRRDARKKEIVCEIYQAKAGSWALERTVAIPRGREADSPFTVEDLNRDGTVVLLRDHADLPDTPQWLVFRLDSSSTTPLGRAKEFGLFLEARP